MKKEDGSHERMRNIMHCLSCLPRKILGLHGRENVIEFVLHELSKQECFDLERAAYVVDNPDFNCIKGVAGFCRPEAYQSQSDIWDEPDDFSEHMLQSAYNKKIRSFERDSCVKKGEKSEQIVKEIAEELGFEHPSFYTWKMKHDNSGILLYEKHDKDAKCECDYLLDGLCLIGFCPVY